MLIKVGLCSIISPIQASKAFYLQEPLQQLMPLFLYEVPLDSR